MHPSNLSMRQCFSQYITVLGISLCEYLTRPSSRAFLRIPTMHMTLFAGIANAWEQTKIVRRQTFLVIIWRAVSFHPTHLNSHMFCGIFWRAVSFHRRSHLFLRVFMISSTNNTRTWEQEKIFCQTLLLVLSLQSMVSSQAILQTSIRNTQTPSAAPHPHTGAPPVCRPGRGHGHMPHGVAAQFQSGGMLPCF